MFSQGSYLILTSFFFELPVCVWVFCGYFDFPTIDYKCECECEWFVVSVHGQVIDWRTVEGVPPSVLPVDSWAWLQRTHPSQDSAKK